MNGQQRAVQRAHHRERLVRQASPGIAAQTYLDAPTQQLKLPTEPLPAQHVYGGLWLVPLLLIVIAVLVAAGLLPLVILLGVFG